MVMDYVNAPELTNFGSLLRFALELESFLEQVYGRLAQKAGESAKEVLEKLCKQHTKRGSVLSRVQRENLSEMILEPLDNLHGQDYVLPTSSLHSLQQERLVEEIIDMLIDLEQISHRFYRDAIDQAGRILAEVTTSFKRFAQDNLKNMEILQDLKQEI